MSQEIAQRKFDMRKMIDDDVIDLGSLFNTLWRGKWIIALITAIVVMLSGYYAFIVATPYYQSQSVVILEPQQNSIVDLESVVGGLSGGTEEVNSEVKSCDHAV